MIKIIHCNLWGDIECSELAVQIIDTPHFQRLHYIKQTGFSYKVFPSAMTTRFEHSLGVYHVTRLFINHLLLNQPELAEDCSRRKQELICIAGLVHDIGHGPYSHLFDKFLEKSITDDCNWKHHEQRSIHLFENLCIKYKIDIKENEIKFIQKLILGELPNTRWYHQIINNKYTGLDTDKIDYVLRDSMSHGMSIRFDPYRIIKNCRVIDEEICFCNRIKDEIITIFMVRNKMNRFIYRHKKICKYEEALIQILSKDSYTWIIDMILKKDIDRFLTCNDYTLLFSIPPDRWNPIECRHEKVLSYDNSFCDKEWEKIQNLSFYLKQDVNQKIKIDDWNNTSCF